MAAGGQKLRLGTRGSLLALAQSRLIAAELERLHLGLTIELITIKTTGDRITDRPLHDLGGKGLFTKELEQALLRNEIDFAVHSFKDVPITMPLVDQADLMTAAVPLREDARDVLISLPGCALHDLPQGARVGTGSLRRRSQLLEVRPDLAIEPIRGNIDTRIQKLRRGEFDSIVLALAGLRRSALFDAAIATVFEPDELLPAPGQGALSLQCRREDERTRHLLGSMNDSDTAACVGIEREVVRILQGDCHSPIAAFAVIDRDGVQLRIAVGEQGGNPPILVATVRAQCWKGADEQTAIASKACELLTLRHGPAPRHQ